MPEINTIYTKDPFMLEIICRYIDGQINYYTDSCPFLLSNSNMVSSQHYHTLKTVIERNFALAVMWTIVKNGIIEFVNSLKQVNDEPIIKTLEIFKETNKVQRGGNPLIKLLLFLIFSLYVTGTQLIVNSDKANADKELKFYTPGLLEQVFGGKSIEDVINDYNKKATTASLKIRKQCYDVVKEATEHTGVLTSGDVKTASVSSTVAEPSGFFSFMAPSIPIAPSDVIASAHDKLVENKKNLRVACTQLFFNVKMTDDGVHIVSGAPSSTESFRALLIDLKNKRDKESDTKNIDVLSELMFKISEMIDTQEKLLIESEFGPLDAMRTSGKDVNVKIEMWLDMIFNILENLRDNLTNPYALKNKNQQIELADTMNARNMANVEAAIIALADESKNTVHEASNNAEKSETNRNVEYIKSKGLKAKAVLKTFSTQVTSFGLSFFTGAATGIAQETIDSMNQWLWLLISSPGGLAVLAIICLVGYIYLEGILSIPIKILTLPWKAVKFAWKVGKWPIEYLGGVEVKTPPAPSLPATPVQSSSEQPVLLLQSSSEQPGLPLQSSSEQPVLATPDRKKLSKNDNKKIQTLNAQLAELNSMKKIYQGNKDNLNAPNILRNIESNIQTIITQLARLNASGITRRVKRNKKYPTKNKKYGKLRKFTKYKKRGTKRK